jgi:hypothetical protein
MSSESARQPSGRTGIVVHGEACAQLPGDQRREPIEARLGFGIGLLDFVVVLHAGSVAREPVAPHPCARRFGPRLAAFFAARSLASLSR